MGADGLRATPRERKERKTKANARHVREKESMCREKGLVSGHLSFSPPHSPVPRLSCTMCLSASPSHGSMDPFPVVLPPSCLRPVSVLGIFALNMSGFVVAQARNILTTCFTFFRQMGQISHCRAHSTQEQTWPQSKNRASISSE